jgi:nicotinate-nucleotide--dimethylbenzimidazole phosphoribosyltransferase
VILAIVSGAIQAANLGNEIAYGSIALIVIKAVIFLGGALVLGTVVSPRLFNLASKLRGSGVLLVTALLTPEEIVGRGTGVDDAGYQRKLKAVKQALAVNQPNPRDGLEMLARIGGFEIGGIAGVVLGAAAHGCVVAVDGFISTAGAMIAATLCPAVKGYLVSGHASQELGHQRMLAWLGLEPILDLNLRLGEGTGAVLAIGLVEASCKILSEMATFSEAGVSDKEGESETV